MVILSIVNVKEVRYVAEKLQVSGFFNVACA